MAFYVCAMYQELCGLGHHQWPSSKKRCHTMTKNSSIALHNKTARAPISKGANKGGEGFLSTKASSIQQFFLHWGFSSFSPSAFYLQGWEQQSQVIIGPTSHCPKPSSEPTRAEEATTSLILQGWASSHCKKEGAKGRDPSPKYNYETVMHQLDHCITHQR